MLFGTAKVNANWATVAMSEFEYLIVVISVLYSVVVVRLVNGAVELLRHRNGGWIHTCWLVVIFQAVTLNWWA
jgi:hypothetical protein|tara:strand:- start:65 stop:283 length:219 start_codon:yes stop_codon:yes gene_type:complete